MSNVSEILEQVEEFISASNQMIKNPNVPNDVPLALLNMFVTIRTLFHSHAVIDKETAEWARRSGSSERYMAEKREDQSSVQYHGNFMEIFDLELSRLSTTHKGE